MSAADGVMFVTPETNLILLDYAVLRQISDGPHCSLFWDDDVKITLEKDFVINLFLTLGVDFAPGHLRKLRYFPSDEITFVKQNGAPGWYRMFVPGKEDKNA